MKKALLVLTVLFSGTALLSVTAWGQLITSDDFNYGDNALLTANGWTAHSSGGTNPIAVGSSNGLTYSGYLGSGVGNAAKLVNTGEDDSKTFTAITSGTIYYSFLVNIITGTSGYFVHVGGSTTAFAARVYVQPSATSGKINFYLSNRSNDTPPVTPTDFDPLTTYLLIVKYDVSTTGTCSLWVKTSGVPVNEIAAGAPEDTSASNGQASIDRICLRQYAAAQSMVVDGIRVGTTWNDSPLPVELTNFTALARGSKVELNWNTATEVNNHGFEVERSVISNQFFKRQSAIGNWSKVGFVEGHGTTNAPQNYSYIDEISSAGTFLYRLKQIDRDGAFQYSNSVEVTTGLTADDYHLGQNFPNPFNPLTTIRFAVKSPQRVSLNVFNMLGQGVRTLCNQEAEAGVVYVVSFDGSGLPSGVYYYRLRTADRTEMKKMLMVK